MLNDADDGLQPPLIFSCGRWIHTFMGQKTGLGVHAMLLLTAAKLLHSPKPDEEIVLQFCYDFKKLGNNLSVDLLEVELENKRKSTENLPDNRILWDLGEVQI